MKEPIDSRQLRAFVTLVKTGSFTKTAKQLYLSQSAISHSIKALEDDVGCLLLDRVGKKVALTLAGEQLLQHAEKVLHEMDVARDSLQKLGKWGRSRLRIGASTTACQYLLPPVLREFRKEFPQCLLWVVPGDVDHMVDMIERGEIDAAITLEPHNRTALEFLPLFSDELWFVMDPQHPWALSGRVDRAEIARQNYILYHRNSYIFRLVEEYFREEKMVLNLFIELGSMEAIKELVKLGLGISILAPWTARQELLQKTLVTLPLSKRKLKRNWGILRRRGKRPTLAEETFVSLSRSICASVVGQPDVVAVTAAV